MTEAWDMKLNDSDHDNLSLGIQSLIALKQHTHLRQSHVLGYMGWSVHEGKWDFTCQKGVIWVKEEAGMQYSQYSNKAPCLFPSCFPVCCNLVQTLTSKNPSCRWKGGPRVKATSCKSLWTKFLVLTCHPIGFLLLSLSDMRSYVKHIVTGPDGLHDVRWTLASA